MEDPRGDNIMDDICMISHLAKQLEFQLGELWLISSQTMSMGVSNS